MDFPCLGNAGKEEALYPPCSGFSCLSPHLAKSPPHQIFISPPPTPPTKQHFSSYNPIKTVIITCSHCSCSILVLISYFLDTQVMLILILIDVQYSQKAVFSFEKSSNSQNHFSSGFLHPVKILPSKISDSQFCSKFFA